MTDLPQLQQDLVAAARRRARRLRAVGVATRGLAVAALVAAVVVVAGALGDQRGDEVEVPAAENVSAPRTLAEAFGVFRRPARAEDRYRGFVPVAPDGASDLARFCAANPGACDEQCERSPQTCAPKPESGAVDRSRLVATLGDQRYFLVESGDSLCLMSMAGERPGGGGCGDISYYLDGKHPIGSYSDEEGPSAPVFAFPDGVEEVELQLVSGAVERVPVEDNAIARRVESRVARLSWTAPDGTPQKLDLHGAPAFDPADFYSVLRRPARAGDELDGSPTARLVAERDGARAWLVPRDGQICLAVRSPSSPPAAVEGCRAKVADVRRAIIVIVPGVSGDRIAFAAFPNAGGTQPGDPGSLTLLRGDTHEDLEIRDNTAAFDAEDLDEIRYRNPAGDLVTDRLPASADAAVLNAEERR
jgi:hypothetical protein